MHDRCVCTPPSGRKDCSQVQSAGGTPIILTLLPRRRRTQLGEVRRHAAGLVAGKQLRRRAPTGFVLEMIRAATPAATRMIE